MNETRAWRRKQIRLPKVLRDAIPSDLAEEVQHAYEVTFEPGRAACRLVDYYAADRASDWDLGDGGA
jgi:hypothetical protein